MYTSTAWKGQLSLFTFPPNPSAPPRHSLPEAQRWNMPLQAGQALPIFQFLKRVWKSQTALGQGLTSALDPAPFPGTSALHLIFSLPSFFLSFLSVLGSCTDHPGEFGDLGMGTQHAETCHPQAPLFQLLAHTSSAVLADCSPGRVFHGYLSGGSTK